jgi:hypothetical protein
MARDQGTVSHLVKELQERIAALAVLARPIGTEPAPAESAMREPEAAGDLLSAQEAGEASAESQGEPASESAESAPEPSNAGYGGQSWGNRSW